jgi:5-methylcytosine-specific restriction endonuclease McrA
MQRKCARCHDAPAGATHAHYCRECWNWYQRERWNGRLARQCRCEWCDIPFTTMDRRKRFCSRPCKDRAKDAARQAVIEAAKPERQCIHCGVDMPRSMRADARFCSEDCNSAAHNLKRGNGRLGPGRRREIERAYIIERDGSRCHLCGKKCKPEEIHLDHLIPLSRGGTHAYENVRVAHAFCNLSKRDQPRNEQLLLIG